MNRLLSNSPAHRTLRRIIKCPEGDTIDRRVMQQTVLIRQQPMQMPGW
ncbi:hypothetical protein [Muribaculum intestinale]|nr:hypothetical protein [Muribaculum intestinale]